MEKNVKINDFKMEKSICNNCLVSCMCMNPCKEFFDDLPSDEYETNNFDKDCKKEKIINIVSNEGPRFLKRAYNICTRPFIMGWFNEHSYYSRGFYTD